MSEGFGFFGKMAVRYSLNIEGILKMLADAQEEYDPRDVILAAGLASTTLYIVRYTDTVEAGVSSAGDVVASAIKAAAGSGGLPGTGTGIGTEPPVIPPVIT